MADLYEPTKEEIKHCLDFLSKTLVVTICMGDTEKKEVITEGTGVLLTEDKLIFENYYSDRFGSFYQAEKFGSTISMNGSFAGINQEKADFDLTFSGRELNKSINIRSSYRNGETDIVINGRRFAADDLLAMLS